MTNAKMILVTGATGHLGTAVIENLLKKTAADRIAAFTRDEHKAAHLKEQGVQIRIGDYDDQASLEKAMQGIEKVLLISGTNDERRVEQHQNVIDAAKKAGVACLAYTSHHLKDRNQLANQLMLGHFETEDRLKQSGLNYLIFRNALYMDTIPQFVGKQVFETGISLPAGNGRVPFPLRAELGEAIANVLLENDCISKTYKFTADRSYSFADVAQALTTLSGKNVNYTPISQSEFEEQLKKQKLPEKVIEKITGFIIDVRNGQEEETTTELEISLGRKPVSLEEGLKKIFKL